MIIHFSNDQKFIDGFIQKQNKYFPQLNNKYFALSKNNSFNHIKCQSVEPFYADWSYKKLLAYIKEKPSMVVFHCLNRRFFRLINTLPKEIPVVWIFYGTEIFSRGENITHYLGPVTKKNTHPLIKTWLYHKIQYLQFHFELMTNIKLSPFWKAIHRIDYFAHWIKEDYEFIVNRYGLDKIKFINFAYSNKIPQLNIDRNVKNDLLIGHSAAPTNNHLDIINDLPKAFINSFKRIIIPLSYSGTPNYVKAVKKAATNKFGKRVLFLDRFLDKDMYFKLLSGVKLAIMPQYRSQGGGNVRFFLKNGIDIALYKHNNVYKFYKQWGANIQTIESLKCNKFSFLDMKTRNENKKIEQALFKENKIKTYYKSLLFLTKE